MLLSLPNWCTKTGRLFCGVYVSLIFSFKKEMLSKQAEVHIFVVQLLDFSVRNISMQKMFRCKGHFQTKWCSATINQAKVQKWQKREDPKSALLVWILLTTKKTYWWNQKQWFTLHTSGLFSGEHGISVVLMRLNPNKVYKSSWEKGINIWCLWPISGEKIVCGINIVVLLLYFLSHSFLLKFRLAEAVRCIF